MGTKILHPKHILIFSCILLSTAMHFQACKNMRVYDHNIVKRCSIEVFDNSFLWPMRPTSIGKRLLFIDEKETFFIHLFDPLSKRVIYSNYHIGRGPDEMLGPFSFSVPNDSTFWIHDIVLSEIKQYQIVGDSFKLGKKISFKNQHLFYPNIFNDTSFIALNLSNESSGWINKYNKQGDLTKELVQFLENNLELPPLIFMEAFQGTLRTKPDGLSFVLACRYSDMLNIYTADGVLTSSFRTEDPFLPRMKVQTVGNGMAMAQDDETRIGFIDISVSNDYVYALFSGKTRKEKNPTYCNRIMQFRWDGALINEYIFDSPIISMCYSEYYNAIFMFILQDKVKKLAVYYLPDEA